MALELDNRDAFLRILNPAVSTRLTRDLFYNIDHPHFDTMDSFTSLLKPNIAERCAKYAHSFSTVLVQLAEEIRVAIRLLRYEEWNCDILKDALQTLHYQIYHFFGRIAQFLCSHCDRNAGKIYKDSLTFDGVSRTCRNSFVNVELAFYAFIFHLVHGNVSYLESSRTTDGLFAEFRALAATRGVHRIPTTTFTELVLQNMVDNASKSIQNAGPVHAMHYISKL